jgi:hypothetical protein
MPPTSLPIIAVFHTIARGRESGPLLIALIVAGYLATRVFVGAVV